MKSSPQSPYLLELDHYFGGIIQSFKAMPKSHCLAVLQKSSWSSSKGWDIPNSPISLYRYTSDDKHYVDWSGKLYEPISLHKVSWKDFQLVDGDQIPEYEYCRDAVKWLLLCSEKNSQRRQTLEWLLNPDRYQSYHDKKQETSLYGDDRQRLDASMKCLWDEVQAAAAYYRGEAAETPSKIDSAIISAIAHEISSSRQRVQAKRKAHNAYVATWEAQTIKAAKNGLTELTHVYQVELLIGVADDQRNLVSAAVSKEYSDQQNALLEKLRPPVAALPPYSLSKGQGAPNQMQAGSIERDS